MDLKTVIIVCLAVGIRILHFIIENFMEQKPYNDNLEYSASGKYTFELTPEGLMSINKMAIEEGKTINEIIAIALNLVRKSVQSKKEGKQLAVIDTNDCSIVETISF